MTTQSNLLPALERLTRQSARAIVARARLASPGLNRWLTRELMRPAGEPEALLADPVIEVSRSWEPAAESLQALAPRLLSAPLIKALDEAESSRMPKERAPYAHQLRAWEASLREQKSVLVTAGTGAGKTECFLIPILQDCLAQPRAGGGVRAILLYPLNALIESQRERLSAWVRGLGGKVRFALLNGETPETEREAKERSDKFELRSRQQIREQPPEILVTNITMLEYLLLRGEDQQILQRSQGALRWVVLDEAHGYAGSQAAEMALLLRRVRASFGVQPDEVRLIATSATIGGEERTEEKLRDFAAALAGQATDRVAVIEGRERPLRLPPTRMDSPLIADALAGLEPTTLGERLATHLRVQQLRHRLSERGLRLADIASELCGDARHRAEAAKLLDHCARARWDGTALLPWRAHLFHRAQGGLWACPDASCPHRAPELSADGALWPFGATWLSARAKCACGAPVYEVVACTECGTLHLEGLASGGASLRLEPPNPGEGDDFTIDAEPGEDEEIESPSDKAWLAAPAQAGGIEGWLAEDGRWYDNRPPEQQRAWRLRWIKDIKERHCCEKAGQVRLQGLHYGPAFLIGSGLPGLLEDLAPPAEEPGLPCGGRRAISFSDSRQGVARLAAKLQQGAERELTRAFLWHAVQETSTGDQAEIAKLRDKIHKMEAAGLGDHAEDDRQKLAKLTGAANAPIPWSQLVQDLSRQRDIQNFVGEIWIGRTIGSEMERKPAQLAKMLLYRELFRRPRVQNNPETMGLLRLSFPDLETAARSTVPAPLKAVGLDAEGWVGLAYVAMDLVFRQALAVEMPDWMVPLVAPKQGKIKSIVLNRTATADRSLLDRAWPSAVSKGQELTKLAKLIYVLLNSGSDDRIAQDRVAEVLDALWQLISGKAAKDVDRGAYRLDFSKAAVVQLDRAYLCPVTRRPYPYSLGGRSPNDPGRKIEVIELPRLPLAKRMGLTREETAAAVHWCESEPAVQALRDRGLWSDMHDRLAAYPAYLRAQEHSAQIPRPVLKRYEAAFSDGKVNLLNCSTTMEMGVDLADVRLVVNTNVPPALSNYRQRAGRAGRRGEPWAFTLTYCRDLPLDRRTYSAPTEFLQRPIVAPKVWFESASLVQRHVNAALLTAFFAARAGTSVQGSIGAFMGASDSVERPVEDGALVDAFLEELDRGGSDRHRAMLADLVQGTVLASTPAEQLTARAHMALDALTRRWRSEHRILLEAAAAALDKDARTSLELRAKRLKGEFLLGELARRGYTPAYGFPTDVVSFENLSHRDKNDDVNDGAFKSAFKRGTAARSLDQALREYAPGAEVVIDGLVHRAEGILPAWEAGVDVSKLEDLRTLWSCDACGAFDWDRHRPERCPHCCHESLDYRAALRPAGFLGNSPAHVGYENMAFVPFEPARLSAHGVAWLALPEGAGRMRADPAGRVAVTTAPSGLAICLDCGLAHPMEIAGDGLPPGLPKPFQNAHKPLLLRKGKARTRDGFCPGSDAPQRIQKPLLLAQVKQTDVWEWQLPEGSTQAAGLALAAALREALVERLGVESTEVIPSAATSISDTGRRCSVFLHDRAAGGAGLCARLADMEMLIAVLRKATALLDCPDQCKYGCPSCILRPDLNTRDAKLDRPAAQQLAARLLGLLDLPPDLQVFGQTTRLAGRSATAWIKAAWREQRIRGLDLWLHGDPAEWDLSNWPIRRLLPRLDGIRARVLLPETVLTSAGFTLPNRLALHTLAESADILLIDGAPISGDAAVLCQLQLRGSGTERFAVTAAAEALPGAEWGAGSLSAAVVGSGTVLVEGDPLATERLIELCSGNARVLRPDVTLSGDVKGFGKRFWGWLEQHATLEIAALRKVGVARVRYSDRYLLQAYTLRLLAEVLRTMPGRRDAAVEIDLARDDRPPVDPKFVDHNFPTHASREGVLRALIPSAQVQIHEKKSRLPHYRSLVVELDDGRQLELLLDQGFGAWRVRGAVRFDFEASVDQQVRELAELAFVVEVNQPAPPIAMTVL